MRIKKLPCGIFAGKIRHKGKNILVLRDTLQECSDEIFRLIGGV